MMKKDMKKSRPLTRFAALIVCSVLCMTSTSALAKGSPSPSTHLSYTFSYATPTLSNQALGTYQFTTVSMPNTLPMGKDGEPSLPQSIIKIALPPMTTVDSITVTGSSVDVQTPISLLDKPVKPYQHPIPFGTQQPDEIAYNQEQYQTTSEYPSTPYDGQYQIGYCRGYAILSLTLSPVQYLPTAGQIRYYPQLTVSVNLKPTETMNPLYRGLADDEAWVQALVCNPDIVLSYHSQDRATVEYPGGLCDPSGHYDYVIVTHTQNGMDSWATSEETPYNWDSLIARHTSEGLSCTLVTVQDINACTDYQNSDPLFNDLQAHVREFCKDAYQDWGTQYVLFVGSSDTLPARLMDSYAEYDVDADIYWSNLDSTFNENHNNYWGEEGDIGFDLYSELYIGRLTADIPQDISNWMAKSFSYADQGDPFILDNAAFYGGDTGWNCQGDDFEDFSGIKTTNNWLGPDPGSEGPWPTWFETLFGFETWNANYPGIPYNMSNAWTEEPPNPGWHGGYGQGVSGLRNAINNDQVSLISGIAHANEHMSLDVYDSDWASQYYNEHPFFITDYGCHCGDFDASPDTVLDVMLFHSLYLSFGCVYNTGLGWGQFDDTNSSSAVQQKMFWDYFFDTANNSGSVANWQFGKGHAFSKDEMAPALDWGDGTYRETIQCMLLFADPAQKLKPPRENHAPSTPTAPVGPTSGTVAVNYTFTTSSTDPDNDSMLYFFDWGDGTNSGWVGPFPSGGTGNATHFWTSGDTFTVKVQGKDSLGLLTQWSDPVSILIGAPILQVQGMKGGVGVKVTLINVGDGDAKTSWRVTVTGGFRGLITLQKSGNIDALPVNEPQTIHPFGVFVGFGKITIMVEASAVYGNSIKTNATAFLLGPFVLGLKLA